MEFISVFIVPSKIPQVKYEIKQESEANGK